MLGLCTDKCLGSDPASDTIKVDLSFLELQPDDVQPEKENVEPMQNAVNGSTPKAQKEIDEKPLLTNAQQELLWKQEERRQVEEQARKRREDIAAERLRQESIASERAAAERAREEAAAEAAAFVREQEEQIRLQAQRSAEHLARQEREEREAAERSAAIESVKRQEEQLASEQVASWCKAHGFEHANAMKKSFMSGYKFPLHEAVAKNNAEMVALLVRMGADKNAKNSKGQTADAIARKLNKRGSMDAVIARLL